MKKFFIFYTIFIFILILVLGSLTIYMLSSNSKTSGILDIKTVSDNSTVTLKHIPSNRKIELEVAKSIEKRMNGLMLKTSLEENSGMIFISEQESEMTFWMKNTLVSLDVIYLDKNLKVVSFHESTQKNQTTEVYPSNGKALYGIELNAGWSEKNNLNVGDQFEIVGIN